MEHEQARAMNAAAETEVGEMVERWGMGDSAKPQQPQQEPQQSEPEAPQSEDAPERPVEDRIGEQFERLLYGKDAEQAAPPDAERAQAEQQQEPKPKDADALRHNDEAVWTAPEVELINRCESERQYLDQQIARFNDLVAQSDRVEPSKRADFEFRLNMARQELERRGGMLNQALHGLRQSYESRQQARGQRYRDAELQKLKAALPDIVIEKTWSYARSLGFPDEQLAKVRDHREAVLIEKARRYDELQTQRKPKVVRVARPVPKQLATPQANYKRAISRVTDPKARQKLAEDRIGQIFEGM